MPIITNKSGHIAKNYGALASKPQATQKTTRNEITKEILSFKLLLHPSFNRALILMH
jgi:hypothetical protein